MRVLLDENLLSKKLKRPFINDGHSISNVSDMNWRTFKDREILARAEAQPFDVFITADKNLTFQQNLSDYSLRVVVLDSISTRPDHLLPLMIRVSTLISSLPTGAIIRINDAGEVEFAVFAEDGE
jgi:predicted nuclease of predicted toxin-antitoxin system